MGKKRLVIIENQFGHCSLGVSQYSVGVDQYYVGVSQYSVCVNQNYVGVSQYTVSVGQ